MRMSKLWFALPMVWLAISLTVRSDDKDEKAKKEEKEVNLIQNGSFEDGVEPQGMGFSWLNDGDDKSIKHWTVIKGQLSYIGTTYWQHADGKRSLDMHGGPGFGGIKQKFKTKKGQKYRVTFSMAGNPEGQNPMKKLGVSAAGAEEEFTFDCSEKSRQDMEIGRAHV